MNECMYVMQFDVMVISSLCADNMHVADVDQVSHRLIFLAISISIPLPDLLTCMTFIQQCAWYLHVTLNETSLGDT